MKYAEMVRMQRPDAQPAKPFLVESSNAPSMDVSTVDVKSMDQATMGAASPVATSPDPPATVHTSLDATSMDAAVLRAPVKYSCVRAKTAQDAHTMGEQALYRALWDGGHGDDFRLVTAGYGTLSKLARLSDKAVIRNLKSLEQKLAIETMRQENVRTRTGHTYKVYSYRLILDRRRAAGLEWIWKCGHGVYLKTASMDAISMDGTEASMDVATTPSMDVASLASMDGTPTHLGNKQERAGNCSRCNGTGKITYRGRERACGCQV